MNFDEAYDLLSEELDLARPQWLTAIAKGMQDGHQCIFVYTSNVSEAKKTISHPFEGFMVVFKKFSLK